jgi:osmotically-inducible protein OsmY
MLSVLGCSRKPPSEGATRTTGGTVAAPTTVEEIRLVMLDQRPDAPGVVNALKITNDNGIVTLQGVVDDEQMKSDLVKRVKNMPNVRDVRDELKAERKPASGAPQTPQGAHPTSTPMSSAVRTQMTKEQPSAAAVITHLIISDDGSVVVLSGIVPDKSTHDALIKAAKDTPGVKGVRDDLKLSGPKKK